MPKAYISINWVRLSLTCVRGWGGEGVAHDEQPEVVLSAVAAALLLAFLARSVLNPPAPIFDAVLLCGAVCVLGTSWIT